MSLFMTQLEHATVTATISMTRADFVGNELIMICIDPSPGAPGEGSESEKVTRLVGRVDRVGPGRDHELATPVSRPIRLG